jgi:hypothetical protein
MFAPISDASNCFLQPTAKKKAAACSSARQPTESASLMESLTFDYLTMRVGTFNVGVLQKQLRGRKAHKVMESLDRIIGTCAHDGELDIFTMCGVGGHRRGLSDAGQQAANLSVIRQGSAQCSTAQNYLSVWNFRADAYQLAQTQLQCIVHRMNSELACDPQLVVQVFSFSGRAKLIHGNLHIRSPQGIKALTTMMRKFLVKAALEILERKAATEEARERRANGGASQSVVCILVGDTNLLTTDGEAAVQSLQPPVKQATLNNVWQVHGTNAQLGGDILFVKGANAALFELPVGASHRDRGVRNDNHDAFGVQIRVKVCKKVKTCTPERQASGDSQLDVAVEAAPTAAWNDVVIKRARLSSGGRLLHPSYSAPKRERTDSYLYKLEPGIKRPRTEPYRHPIKRTRTELEAAVIKRARTGSRNYRIFGVGIVSSEYLRVGLKVRH